MTGTFAMIFMIRLHSCAFWLLPIIKIKIFATTRNLLMPPKRPAGGSFLWSLRSLVLHIFIGLLHIKSLISHFIGLASNDLNWLQKPWKYRTLMPPIFFANNNRTLMPQKGIKWFGTWVKSCQIIHCFMLDFAAHCFVTMSIFTQSMQSF